jgi:hypothetical protein
MVKCDALTAKFRPCRGHADPETGVCHKHLSWWSADWLPFLKRRVTYFRTCRELAWAAAVMRNPRGVTDPEDLEADLHIRWLENEHRTHSLIIWYDLLVKTGRIRPMRLPVQWMEKMRPLFGIFSDMYYNASPESLDDAIQTLMMPYLVDSSPEFILATYFGLVDTVAPRIEDEVLTEVTSYVMERVPIENCIFQDMEPAWDIVSRNSWNWFARHPPDSEELDVVLNLQINAREILDNRRYDARLAMRERISPFKESLIAAVFHPARLEKLIERHGMDALDAM